MKISGFLVRNKRILLVVLFLLSFSLRLGLTLNEYRAKGQAEWADAALYLHHGIAFSEGNLYPAYDRYAYMVVGPVIPMIVAASKLVTGDPVLPVLVLNCLLTSLLVFVLYKIGAMLISVSAGFLLSIWSVFNFSLIQANFQIYKEPLIHFLLPLLVLCMLKVGRREKTALYLSASALIFSLLIHTDERYIIYAPLITAFVLLTARSRMKLKLAFFWVMLLLVTMIPWTLRNYAAFGEVVILTPRTTAFTSKLWGTDLNNMDFFDQDKQEIVYQAFSERGRKAEIQYGVATRRYGKYEKYWKAFIHYWKPTYFKLTYIMYGNRPMKWSLGHNLNSLLFYGLFLPFYLAGLIFSLCRKNWIIFLLGMLPFIHGLLHTLMVWPLERYRLPLNFLIVLVALWFLFNLSATFRARYALKSLSKFTPAVPDVICEGKREL